MTRVLVVDGGSRFSKYALAAMIAAAVMAAGMDVVTSADDRHYGPPDIGNCLCWAGPDPVLSHTWTAPDTDNAPNYQAHVAHPERPAPAFTVPEARGP